MDPSGFDALTRSLTFPGSRRRVLGAALGGLVGLSALPVAAKKKKKVTLCHQGQTLSVSKKKKKAHLKHGDTLGECPTGTTSTSPPPQPCVPSCGNRICGPDGCGGVCGSCDLCQTCQDGSCVVAPNGTSCYGSPCQLCQSGACVALPLNAPCPGGYCGTGSLDCIPCGADGQPCCPDQVQDCNAGFVCTNSDLCRPCGDVAQRCCPGGTCNTGLECGPGDHCELQCGEEGQRCCNNPPKCDDGLICDMSNSTCVSCGGSGEPCCIVVPCNPGLQCCDGLCEPGLGC